MTSTRLASYTSRRGAEMNSKWIKRLNAARGWILGAGVAAVGIAWLAHR
jgi:hypothetical protein